MALLATGARNDSELSSTVEWCLWLTLSGQMHLKVWNNINQRYSITIIIIYMPSVWVSLVSFPVSKKLSSLISQAQAQALKNVESDQPKSASIMFFFNDSTNEVKSLQGHTLDYDPRYGKSHKVVNTLRFDVTKRSVLPFPTKLPKLSRHRHS